MLGGFPPCKAIVSPQLEFLLVLSIQISVTWVHWKTATVICGNLSLTLITPAVVPKKHILFELIFWNNCAWLNMCREHFEGRWVWLSLISIKMEHPPPLQVCTIVGIIQYMMHTGTGVIRVIMTMTGRALYTLGRRDTQGATSVIRFCITDELIQRWVSTWKIT